MIVMVPAAQGQSEQPGQKGIGQSNNACPMISVSCPDYFKDGDPLTFTTAIQGGPARSSLSYDWSVSGGTIIEGQGTPTIKMKPIGRSFSGVVKVGGLDPTCASIASCSFTIHPPWPPSEKFDSFGRVTTAEEKLRFENFARALKNQPGAQGYVLSYGGRRGFADDAKAIADRVKAYLVNEREIKANRIVMVEGGLREKITVELWVVSTGRTPPTPEPTVTSSGVKLIKLPASKRSKNPKRH
jgi:hypothetical protein